MKTRIILILFVVALFSCTQENNHHEFLAKDYDDLLQNNIEYFNSKIAAQYSERPDERAKKWIHLKKKVETYLDSSVNNSSNRDDYAVSFVNAIDFSNKTLELTNVDLNNKPKDSIEYYFSITKAKLSYLEYISDFIHTDKCFNFMDTIAIVHSANPENNSINLFPFPLGSRERLYSIQYEKFTVNGYEVENPKTGGKNFNLLTTVYSDSTEIKSYNVEGLIEFIVLKGKKPTRLKFRRTFP